MSKMKNKNTAMILFVVVYVLASSVYIWEVRRSAQMEQKVQEELIHIQNVKSPSSVTVLKEAIDFYSSPLRSWMSGRERLRAYHALGNLYHELKQFPDDVITWENGIEQADTLNIACDNAAMYLIYGQLATAYGSHGMLAKREEAIRQQQRHAQLANGSTKELTMSNSTCDSLSVSGTEKLSAPMERYYTTKLRHKELSYHREKTQSRILMGSLLVFCCMAGFWANHQFSAVQKEKQATMTAYQSALKECKASKRKVEELLRKEHQVSFQIHPRYSPSEKDEDALMTSEIVQQMRVMCKLHSVKEKGVMRIIKPRACTAAEWCELIKVVRSCHYSFYNLITHEHPLPNLQHKVCILSRLGFYVSEMAMLLGTSPQSVSNARGKAVQKLYHSNNTALLDTRLSET